MNYNIICNLLRLHNFQKIFGIVKKKFNYTYFVNKKYASSVKVKTSKLLFKITPKLCD